MVKRYFIVFFIVCVLFLSFFVQQSFSEEVKNIQFDMRASDAITIPAGIVIPVINMQEISTETCPIGYKTKFVTTNDIYIDEVNVIPENSEFSGYIEKINEPVVGTNASMKIKIFRLTLPDGFSMAVKGYLYTSNDNIIGGELTAPSEWVKVPHYQDKYQRIAWNFRGPTLQIRPGGKRSMGTHTRLPVGDRQLIILTAPTEVTHTVAE